MIARAGDKSRAAAGEGCLSCYAGQHAGCCYSAAVEDDGDDDDDAVDGFDGGVDDFDGVDDGGR